MRTITLDFSGWLRVLFTPSCWLQNHKYNGKWDRELRRLLSEYKFEQRSRYTARLGPAVLWVANHPYASMMPHTLYGPADFRPSRATILRAGDRFRADCVADFSTYYTPENP